MTAAIEARVVAPSPADMAAIVARLNEARVMAEVVAAADADDYPSEAAVGRGWVWVDEHGAVRVAARVEALLLPGEEWLARRVIRPVWLAAYKVWAGVRWTR